MLSETVYDDLNKAKERTVSLEEANSALKLMLRKEAEIKTELENKVLCNVKKSILPLVQKLKTTRLDNAQRKYLEILESNIEEIVSPFLYLVTSNFRVLTPGEIQVANHIKQGMVTKEIADLMNVSARTVESHRANIRKKLGITNRTKSLRFHLMSLE